MFKKERKNQAYTCNKIRVSKKFSRYLKFYFDNYSIIFFIITFLNVSGL